MSSPLRHIRESVHVAQVELGRWALRVAAEAGATGVSLAPKGAGVRLGLYPLRAAALGRSGDTQGQPLLTPPEYTREPPTGVPAAWGELARAIQVGLDSFFPRPDARPSTPGRPRASPEVRALPKPLADWYLARGAESADWTWMADGVTLARTPTLVWRPPVTVRLAWLLAVENAGDEAMPLSAALLAALAYENSFPVTFPPIFVDPHLRGFTGALARSLGGAPAAELGALVERLEEPVVTQVSVAPSTELSASQLAQYAVALGRPGVPHLPLVVGVTAGAVATFAPTAVPAFKGSPRSQGDPG